MHLWKNSYAEKPESTLDIPELVEKLQDGFWKKEVLNLRSKSGEEQYKKLKRSLPAITISSELTNRDKRVPIEKRLKKHTGYICLDIDKKDNPKMRVKDIIDPDALLEYVSCSGEGKKIVYKCTPAKDNNEHRRIYDAAVLRLRDKGINIKVDPIVKSIASLQYVSFDPYLYYNEKSKITIKPLPKPKKAPNVAAKKDEQEVTAQLQQYIKALGNKDCTANYEDWIAIAFGLAHTFGEHGRGMFHALSKNYKDYAAVETDEKYDSVLDRNIESLEKPRTIASVFQVINDHLPKPVRKQLAKRFAHSHAVARPINDAKGVQGKATKNKGAGNEIPEDIGEINLNTDLEGMVRYKLFLFKKIIDKELKQVTDLLPHSINLNAFEALLRAKGFYRFEKGFVQVLENIVDVRDADDILRIVTEHIEAEGNYHFVYKGTEFIVSWEELVHLWRKVRGNSTIYNQLRSSLVRWEPNLLSDTEKASYIPYRNGVVEVTAKGTRLVPYNELKQQIWKERILPRNFQPDTRVGMFQQFFANVCGRGDNFKQRVASERYKHALWYYGYMLHSFKIRSLARMWLLYDIRTGNNGRSGKTIIGQAVGKIRSMVIIDGKTLDLTQRFAFQTVNPWTDVLFIDDYKKNMSLVPMFNMITGDFQTDKKNEQPLIKQLKIMGAGNYILEAENTSESGRQFITQLDDFYIKYAQEHNTIAPLVHLHKKEFFDGWDENDWSMFDNFSIQALKYYLSTRVPESTTIKDALLLRFIQVYEEEMFFELATLFKQHAKENRDGKLMVVMNILTSAIVDHSKHMKSLQAAGYVARGFLKAIGGGEVSVTNTDVAGQVKQAYRLSVGWAGIDFGRHNEGLGHKIRRK